LPAQPLPVTAPESSPAGEPVFLTIGPAALPDGSPVQLLLLNSAGVWSADGLFQDGYATITLTGRVTEIAGLATVEVVAAGYRGSADFVLHAAPTIHPVTPLIGARTIVANGSDWSMTVVVPFDRYGNPQPDGTPVTVRSLHPDGRLESRQTVVRDLLAWVRLTSGTRAGRTLIAVEADGQPGPEGTLFEVPGPPVPFRLSADPPTLPADGRLLSHVRTSPLTDPFGNLLPDGTLVTLRCDDPDGTVRFLTSVTIDGSAEFLVQASIFPGDLLLTAVAFGVTSHPLALPVTPNADTIPLSLTLDAATGLLHLSAGPLLGRLGQFVPDGTVIRFRLLAADGTPLPWLSPQPADPQAPLQHRMHVEGVADGGHAHVTLHTGSLAAGRYTIEATAGAASGLHPFVWPLEETR
jgi:hypothetical protein